MGRFRKGKNGNVSAMIMKELSNEITLTFSLSLFFLFQTPAAATSEAAGSPTGAEGLLLAAAHLGPLGTESPVGGVDGGEGKKKGGKKPRRSAVNIVYGRKSY